MGKWLATILSTVIAGLIVYSLTEGRNPPPTYQPRPVPTYHSDPPPTYQPRTVPTYQPRPNNYPIYRGS